MKIDNIKKYIRGWIFGNFEPTLLKTNEFEFAIKKYDAGAFEAKHHHKIATEYTFVISGKIKMNGVEYGEDEIIIIEPGDSTDFLALEKTVCAVIKYPGASNDKYID
jgi:hypothetical protein